MLSHENFSHSITLTGSKGLRWSVLMATIVVTCTLYLLAKPSDPVPYPTGYRNWVHVRTTLVGAKHPTFEQNGGFHHYYANEKAMEGYRTGKFPDGSVIVDDGLELREHANGATTEGARRRIAVMMKDSRRYAETGGWGFEVFKGDSQTDRLGTAEVVAKCFACHGEKKEQDYVFTTYRK
jgi:hypothetical protein